MRYIATLIALVAVASIASAAVETVVNDTTSFSGYVVNKISVDFGTDEWITGELIVLPDADDKVYNGSYTYYDPNLFMDITVDTWTSHLPVAAYGPRPQMEFDSRIATGVFASGSSPADVSKESAPATEDLYLPTVAAGNDLIRITWWTQSITETGNLDLAMVTLADDAGGTWSFRAFDENSAEDPAIDIGGDIVDGALVPEPATMLVMLGGLGVLLRRRK